MNSVNDVKNENNNEDKNKETSLHITPTPQGLKALGVFHIFCSLFVAFIFVYKGLIKGVEIDYVNLGVLSLAFMVIGIGIYTVSRWGFFITIAFMTVQFGKVLYRIIIGESANMVALALPVLVIVYLLGRKELFFGAFAKGKKGVAKLSYIILACVVGLIAIAGLVVYMYFGKDSGVSHFSTIGFSVTDEESMGDMTEKVLKIGDKILLPESIGGSYYRLSLPEGPQMWVATNTHNKVEGFNPYFQAKSVNRVKITREIKNSDWRYEGAFYAWAGPEEKLIQISDNDDANSIEGAFPFSFDCPSFLTHSSEKFPKEVDLRLTAFAHGLDLYKNEDDFKNRSGENKLAVKSFIPSGLFKIAENEEIGTDATEAFFSGTVKEARLVKNSMTGLDFYWMSVETHVLTIDLVAEKSLFNDMPQPGNIVCVTAWLTGDWENK